MNTSNFAREQGDRMMRRLQHLWLVDRDLTAYYALSVLKPIHQGYGQRAYLRAILDASLGITDSDIAKLRDDGESWLAHVAPHEYEHFRIFRVAYTLKMAESPAQVVQAWEKNPQFYVVPSVYGRASVAINRDDYVIQRMICSLFEGMTLLATGQTFSDLGLGYAIRYDVEQAITSVPDCLFSVCASPVAKLPAVSDCLRERECNEIQIQLLQDTQTYRFS